MDFSFNTIDKFQLNIYFGDANGNALPNIEFDIYDRNPFQLEEEQLSSLNNTAKLLFSGNSNKQGQIEVALNIPTYTKKLYICPKYHGLHQFTEVEISAPNQTLTITTEKRTATKSAVKTIKATVPDGYLALGDWNSQGLPDYLENPGDEISKDLLNDVNASLPEGSKLPDSHPQYLAEGVETNLVIKETCEIWVTFVHEGAGWRNILGYYTYDKNNPPQAREDIAKKIIIFPNVSYNGSGGSLHSGDKIQLKYYDETTNTFSNTFPPNTVVGWFLNGNGWNGNITGGNYTHYSNPELNLENDESLKTHNVLLYDEERELMLLGFEDIRRDKSYCDQDFNDAIFYTTVNPITAVETNNLQVIDTPKDTDGDGVTDTFDKFPEDANRAHKSYYPSSSQFGTLVYEDMWPHKGDYDFNDLVIDYQFEIVTNADNLVKEINPKFLVRAIGASFQNGFGIAFGSNPSSIESVTGQNLTEGLISNSGNGTENQQNKAVVMIFDNAFNQLKKPAGGGFINTDPDLPYIEGDTIKCSIILSSPLSTNQIGLPPYNPFIFTNKRREVEIHLPGQAPTDLADITLFGTGQDLSDPGEQKYYFSSQEYPWAINIPENFNYPIEKASIVNAYLVFGNWAASKGYNYQDWYQNKSNYRNNSNIFQKP
ncbi:MAG: LruC domain-containing protein [Marinifilaceae bacterium]